MLRYKISVSQITSFWDIHAAEVAGIQQDDGCPRRWALRILGKSLVTKSVQLSDGIRLHDCLKRYFDTTPAFWAHEWPPEYTGNGTPAEVARQKTAALARAMLTTAPQPAGVICEPNYHDHVHELDTSFYVKPDLHHPERISFADWKSTGCKGPKDRWVLQDPVTWTDPTKPMPATHKVLSEDVQARVYSNALMNLWGTENIEAQWIYGSKQFKPGDNPKTWIVRHTFEREDTVAWVRMKIWPIVRVMNQIREVWESEKLDSLLKVPHNPTACNYKGRNCDSLGVCLFLPSPVPMSALTEAIR